MDKKLNSLQALRGVAALLVLLFHYRFYLRGDDRSSTTIWDSLFGWGIIGVDIFFVISGFIMVYTTQHYQHGFAFSKKFLINRVVRIIPLYYFALLIAFLLGGAMSIFHYPEKTQNLLSALTFTVYDINITPHYINDSGMYNIRWTLNYEIYFYLIFSLCILVKYKAIALFSYAALAMCVIPALAGFQPTFSVQGYKFETPFYAFLSNPIFIEFLIGVIAGYAYIWIKKQIPSSYLSLLSSIATLALFIYIAWGIYTGSIRALNIESTVIIGAFILLLTLADPVISKIIPNALIYLGNISFSLYLLHATVGIAVMDRLGPEEHANAKGIPWVILATVLSMIVAHFTHKYIEIRLTHWLKAKFLLPSFIKIDNINQESKTN